MVLLRLTNRSNRPAKRPRNTPQQHAAKREAREQTDDNDSLAAPPAGPVPTAAEQEEHRNLQAIKKMAAELSKRSVTLSNFIEGMTALLGAMTGEVTEKLLLRRREVETQIDRAVEELQKVLAKLVALKKELRSGDGSGETNIIAGRTGKGKSGSGPRKKIHIDDSRDPDDEGAAQSETETLASTSPLSIDITTSASSENGSTSPDTRPRKKTKTKHNPLPASSAARPRFDRTFSTPREDVARKDKKSRHGE